MDGLDTDLAAGVELRQLRYFVTLAEALHFGRAVMCLYRSSPGPLPGGHFGDGLILADAATVLLID